MRKPSSADAASDGYRLDEQVGYVLRRAHQRASDVFAREMARFDITPVQFSTMVRLAQAGEMTRGDLRRQVAMDPATAVGVVRRLMTRGLVTQRTDPRDARRLLIVLTPRGQQEIDAMMRAAEGVTQATLAPLDEAERRLLIDLLERLAFAVDG